MMAASFLSVPDYFALLSSAIDSLEPRFCTGNSFEPCPINVQLLCAAEQLQPLTFPNAAGATSLTDFFDRFESLVCAEGQDHWLVEERARLQLLTRPLRLVLQIHPCRIETNFNPATTTILDEVRRALVPEVASIRAELWELAVMGAGCAGRECLGDDGSDCAEAEGDSEGADTFFGWLEVVLPSPFVGGQVQLSMNGRAAEPRGGRATQDGQLAAGAETHGGGQLLQWAAWFGEARCEVQAVQVGCRIALVYQLHHTSPAALPVRPLLVRASALHSAFDRALASPGFMPEGGVLGFRNRHGYTEAQLARCDAALEQGGSHAHASSLSLKNEDAVAAAALVAGGVRMQCLRLIRLLGREGGGGGGTRAVQRMPTSKDEAAELFHQPSSSQTDVDKAVVWLGSYEPFSFLLDRGRLLASSAVIARIPPYAERMSRLKGGGQHPLTTEMTQPYRACRFKQPAASEVQQGAGAGSSCHSSSSIWNAGAPLQQQWATAARPPTPQAPTLQRLTAPAELYHLQDPAVMTAAQRIAAALASVRQVRVRGGRPAAPPQRFPGGVDEATFTLQPGQGLSHLKAQLRAAFPALPVGLHLMLLDGDTGEASNRSAMSRDLMDGVCVACRFVAKRSREAGIKAGSTVDGLLTPTHVDGVWSD